MAINQARGPAPAYFLADGTALIDAIRARGLRPQTVYARMRRGASPDEAVSATPRIGRPPRLMLADGRAFCDAVSGSGADRHFAYLKRQKGASPDAALSLLVARQAR